MSKIFDDFMYATLFPTYTDEQLRRIAAESLNQAVGMLAALSALRAGFPAAQPARRKYHRWGHGPTMAPLRWKREALLGEAREEGRLEGNDDYDW